MANPIGTEAGDMPLRCGTRTVFVRYDVATDTFWTRAADTGEVRPLPQADLVNDPDGTVISAVRALWGCPSTDLAGA